MPMEVERGTAPTPAPPPPRLAQDPPSLRGTLTRLQPARYPLTPGRRCRPRPCETMYPGLPRPHSRLVNCCNDHIPYHFHTLFQYMYMRVRSSFLYQQTSLPPFDVLSIICQRTFLPILSPFCHLLANFSSLFYLLFVTYQGTSLLIFFSFSSRRQKPAPAAPPSPTPSFSLINPSSWF